MKILAIVINIAQLLASRQAALLESVTWALSMSVPFCCSFVYYRLNSFWVKIKDEHPDIAEKALTILLQFSISYFCRLFLLTLTKNTKQKYS